MSRSNASRPPAGLRSLEDAVKAAQAGDAEAVRDVILACASSILGTVRRIVGARHPDVEDIAQDAAIHLVKALPSYRGECSLRHFACRVATNRALAARRHAGYRQEWTPAVDPTLLEQHADVDADEEDPMVAAQKRAAVRALLDELPPAQSEALALYFVMGLTAEEIAATTGVGVPAVRGRLRLARQELKARIEGNVTLSDMLKGSA
ncbi:MAG: sigma-70 family RNA polymerase sigma factor [Deltaproteobacteria bacterium]|nr:sigma-70 family RNA polymerase sigma factor [Deltaproteobacteria bacterium]